MNNQQIDKIVNFYRINHGFHEPYNFILDGNFIKLLVQKQLDFKHKLGNVIKGRLNIKVTSCILRQLQLLGDHFKIVLSKAKEFKIINCKHSLEHTVDQCILEQIGNNNQRQNMVCSQDVELRRRLREFQNVPLVYFGPDQRITMEDIHKKTIQKLENNIKDKFMPAEKQLKQVKELKEKQKAEQKKQKIKQLSAQKGIQIKTKIAKGPNPLSIKKKQQKVPQQHQQPVSDEAKPKRKRIRKRNKKEVVSHGDS